MRRPRAPNPCPARKPSGSWCEASPGRDCRRVYEICCPGRFAFSDVNHLAPRRHAAPSAKPAIPDAPGFARGLFPELILTLLSPLCSCRMARAPACVEAFPCRRMPPPPLPGCLALLGGCRLRCCRHIGGAFADPPEISLPPEQQAVNIAKVFLGCFPAEAEESPFTAAACP